MRKRIRIPKRTVSTSLAELTEHFTLTDWRKVRTEEYYEGLSKTCSKTQETYIYLKVIEYMKGEAFNTISSFKIMEI